MGNYAFALGSLDHFDIAPEVKRANQKKNACKVYCIILCSYVVFCFNPKNICNILNKADSRGQVRMNAGLDRRSKHLRPAFYREKESKQYYHRITITWEE